jgi:hypothetical protein
LYTPFSEYVACSQTKEKEMKTRKLKLAGGAVWVALVAMPVATHAADDSAFNQMLGTMAASDTGSGWFDYYVEHLNQEISFKAGTEAFGAAGPNGPLDGFNGYIAGFRVPDTGSQWFNGYVDAVNHVIREKQQYQY